LISVIDSKIILSFIFMVFLLKFLKILLVYRKLGKKYNKIFIFKFWIQFFSNKNHSIIIITFYRAYFIKYFLFHFLFFLYFVNFKQFMYFKIK